MKLTRCKKYRSIISEHQIRELGQLFLNGENNSIIKIMLRVSVARARLDDDDDLLFDG